MFIYLFIYLESGNNNEVSDVWAVKADCFVYTNSK
jgi:hypothetical protein